MKYLWALAAFILVTGGAYRAHPLLGIYVVVILLTLWLWNRAVRWHRQEVGNRGRW